MLRLIIIVLIIPILSMKYEDLSPDEKKAIEKLKKYYIEIQYDRDGIVIEITSRWAEPKDIMIDDKELNNILPLKKHLKKLSISYNKITKIGFSKLKDLTNLIILDIESSNFNDDCSDIFIRMAYLKQLRLKLANISTKTILRIVELKKLELLDLSGTKIRDEDLRSIASMKKLQYLELNNTNISDEGVNLLSLSNSIISVGLNKTKITDKSITYLKRMKQLRYVSIKKTNISPKKCIELTKLISNQERKVGDNVRIECD